MSKLYLLSGPKFELPFLVDSGHHVMTIPADNLPMLYWPDYSWCYEANVFMRMLYERQLSRRTRGGTLHTYGTQISHLLRYCALNKWELEELTDNQFTLFINFLKAERNPYRPSRPRRRFNQVIQIGKKCLEFLECIGRIHGLRNFVGPTGVIRAERKQSTIRLGESGIRNILVRTHWHHRSFPRENPITRRLPIGEDAIERLRAAVEEISPTPYLRMRRYVMLNLLEILGLRRVELACLTVKSVRAAFNSDWPALELITVKSRM